VSVSNTAIYFLYFKIVYRQGDMFRPSLGHPQALKENRSKTTYIYIYIYLQNRIVGSQMLTEFCKGTV